MNRLWVVATIGTTQGVWLNRILPEGKFFFRCFRERVVFKKSEGGKKTETFRIPSKQK